MKQRLLTFLFLVGIGFVGAKAQIGYQVALLNSATGEARANETVTVNISLSNSANEIFYTETKSATTNDFGVLSLSIGNADTFKNVDLSKMPFYIEVTANDVMIGKSQVLSVPVAEIAKQLAPAIDKSKIIGAWQYQKYSDLTVLTFKDNGTGTYQYIYVTSSSEYQQQEPISFEYIIEGNNIYLLNSNDKISSNNCRFHNDYLYWNGKKLVKK